MRPGGALRGALRRLRAVGDHLDPLEREHAVADHLVQGRQDGLDPLRSVDHLDHDGEVVREAKDPSRMQVALRAKALDTAEDRRTREALLAQHLDDRLVERLAPMAVRLADEDAKQLALTL